MPEPSDPPDVTRIRRTVETELAPDELWHLARDGDEWATWMVDEADVTVAPGAGGSVVDDGVTFTVRIDVVDDDGDDQRVGFTWWPEDRPDLASAVELVVLPAPTGSRLLITETQACAAPARTTWDVRLLLLGVRAPLLAV